MTTFQTDIRMHEKVGKKKETVCDNTDETVELKEVAVLNCDISSIPLEEIDTGVNPVTRRQYYTAYLKCEIKMRGTQLELKILWNDRVLCQSMIQNIKHKGSVSEKLASTTKPKGLAPLRS